ncbi:hypothetical protein D3C71_2145290 [compost metagenome]
MFLELTLWVFAPLFTSMTWQNATARFMASWSPFNSSVSPCFAKAFQQPMILAASSTLSWLFSSLSRP